MVRKPGNIRDFFFLFLMPRKVMEFNKIFNIHRNDQMFLGSVIFLFLGLWF